MGLSWGALKAACNLASSSCESEVLKDSAAYSSSNTFCLSGVAFLTRTNPPYGLIESDYD
jgi:hypothetical protein